MLMKDTLISRAMRELGRRRMASLTVEERKELARTAGKARWANLTDEERRAAIKRLQKQRRAARAK
jgi:hypothetical protein